MACPNCDTLYRLSQIPARSRAKCVRCETVLATSRDSSINQILALSITATILMIMALFFPFLTFANAQDGPAHFSIGPFGL